MNISNNPKIWCHIKTSTVILLKLTKQLFITSPKFPVTTTVIWTLFSLFPPAWSNSGPRCTPPNMTWLYLFQLLFYLHRPLDYGTTDRVLNPPHIGVHVVQSQHLAPARAPVHRLLGHFFLLSRARRWTLDWYLKHRRRQSRRNIKNEQKSRYGNCTRADKTYQLLPVDLQGDLLSLQLLWAPTHSSRCSYSHPAAPPSLAPAHGWLDFFTDFGLGAFTCCREKNVTRGGK